MVRRADPDARLPQFAVAVYRADGVSAACLTLQDRYDVDVNLVLCAAYLGAVHRHVPSDDERAALRGAVTAWHTEIVRPLRAVRRRLKTGPPPAPGGAAAQLRSRIQRDEIEAEVVELGVLDAVAAEFPRGTHAGAAAESAAAAIALVLDTTLTDSDRAAVETIAAAAADRADTVRGCA